MTSKRWRGISDLCVCVNKMININGLFTYSNLNSISNITEINNISMGNMLICELIYVHAHMWASYTNKMKKNISKTCSYMIIYGPYVIIELIHMWACHVLICEHGKCSHMSMWHVRIWSYVCLICEQACSSYMNIANVHIWVLTYEQFSSNNICTALCTRKRDEQTTKKNCILSLYFTIFLIGWIKYRFY